MSTQGNYSRPADKTFRAAQLRVDITPQHLPILAGSGNGVQATKIADPLEANFLLLEDGNGVRALIVSLDLLYPGQEVRRAIETSTSTVPPDRILVAASHTHNAPATDRTKPNLGLTDGRYMERLLQILADACREIESRNLETVSITTSAAKATHSINRRKKKLFFLARRPIINQMMIAPNRKGSTDENITTVTVLDSTGEPICAIWNYACHPVSHYAPSQISAHFPGVVREAIRRQCGSRDIPVVYLQGFSGNVRPNATTKPSSFKAMIRILTSGATFSDLTKRSYHRWTTSLSDVVVRNQATADSRNITGRISGHRWFASSTEFVEGGRNVADVSFSILEVGPLVFVAISGEPVVEYARHLREYARSKILIPVGCVDTPLGYFPTASMFKEGGYEVIGHCSSFGYERLSPNLPVAIETNLAIALQSIDWPAIE